MEPTIKKYDENAYETSFDSELISVSDGGDGALELVLKETLFFPEEGGQTPDRGFIEFKAANADAGLLGEVIDVQIRDEVITHFIRPETGTISDFLSLVPGSLFHGEIDWKHRFSNMQNHTGEHIFSGLVNRRFGYNNAGFHLSDDIVTMDYDGKLIDEDIAALELEVNRIIYEAHEVKCYYPSSGELDRIEYRSKKEIEGAVRLVEIEDVDVCACCAPHVRNTSEVGLLKVVGYENYKGGTRLSILCGMRAVKDYIEKHDITKALSGLMSSPVSELPQTAERVLGERDEARHNYHQMRLDAMVELCQKEAAAGTRFLFTEETDDNIVRAGVNTLTESFDSGFSGIFFAGSEDSYRYIIGSSGDSDAREAAAALKEKLGARGGGKPQMVQGQVAGKQAEIVAAISF